MDADANFYRSIHIRDEEESNTEVLPAATNRCRTGEGAAIQAAESKLCF